MNETVAVIRHTKLLKFVGVTSSVLEILMYIFGMLFFFSRISAEGLQQLLAMADQSKDIYYFGLVYAAGGMLCYVLMQRIMRLSK